MASKSSSSLVTFLLLKKQIPMNPTCHSLITWHNKNRLFMDRLHGKSNVRTLVKAMNRFPWGVDHIIPYFEPIMIECTQTIILTVKYTINFTLPEYIHCRHI